MNRKEIGRKEKVARLLVMIVHDSAEFKNKLMGVMVYF
jgi:hypothetical protein